MGAWIVELQPLLVVGYMPVLCDLLFVSCSLWPHRLTPTGSSACGISQARIQDWIAIPFSRGSSQPRGRNHLSSVSCILVKVMSLSRVRLFAIPWTVVYQASLSMGFSRQEYWSGLPFPSPGDLPDPGIEPMSPALQADALPSDPFFTSEPPGMLPLVVRIRQSMHLRKIPWLAPPVVASDWSPTMFTQKPDSVICAYHWQTIYVSIRWGLTHLILLIGTI